jgi:hypothetical protein
MKVEEWKKGLEAWENVKKQAVLDMEQAELYIKAIKDKIAEVEKNGK